MATSRQKKTFTVVLFQQKCAPDLSKTCCPRCLIENKVTVAIHNDVKRKHQHRKEANKMEDK